MSAIRVSQNEVYRTAQRALEAAGAPFGLDRDGALAVAWLEARQLPGLELLAVALGRLDGAFDSFAAPELDGTPAVLDLAGRPAVVASGAVLDCLGLLRDRRGGPAPLSLRRCRWPLFLLPALAAASVGGTGFLLRWRYGAATVTCIAEPSGRCRIVLESSRIDLGQVVRSSGPVEVLVQERTSSVRHAGRADHARIVDAETLEAALRRTLTAGILVDDALWARIGEVAARVLVPPSDESRQRGAGGGDPND